MHIIKITQRLFLGISLIALVVSLVPFSFASADATSKLPPLALFNRCYSHLTGMVLPTTHPYYQSVKSGAMLPVDACMKIFDSAKLGAAGAANDGMLITDTPESRAVLRTLNDFHRQWFSAYDISTSTPSGNTLNGYITTFAIHDSGEAALFITRAAFGSGVNYSEVLTQDSGMEAIRTGAANPVTAKIAYDSAYKLSSLGSDGKYYLFGANFPQASAPGSPTNVPMNIQAVQFGTLVGVKPTKLNPGKNNAQIFSKDLPFAIDVNKSSGGGIIGTPSYLLLNMGRADFTPMDGGFKQNRRWSVAVLHDLLCRNVPVIRNSDAALYVQTQITTDTPPFRKTTNCMACHSTIDPMAGTARNFQFAAVPSAASVMPASVHVAKNAVSMPRESGFVDKDVNFMKRPPNGSLLYRDYQGSLVNEPVDGIQALGQALANHDDPYICAASRYLNYFTGIGVTIQDPNDPANPPQSADDLANLALAIQLGKNLRKTQSVRQLIQDILSLQKYQTNSMR